MPSRTRLRATTSRKMPRSAASPTGAAIRKAPQRPREPRQMPRLVDQRAAPDLADFVDAVAEIQRAIVDGNAGFGVRDVAAIDISDATHGRAFARADGPAVQPAARSCFAAPSCYQAAPAADRRPCQRGQHALFQPARRCSRFPCSPPSPLRPTRPSPTRWCSKTQVRRRRHPAAPRSRAQARRADQGAGEAQVLRRHRVPSRHPRLHGADRRSHRHRHGRLRPAEHPRRIHRRRRSSAARSAWRARSDPNSANSQFFICFADAPFLDGKYTVFGEVVSGMDTSTRSRPDEATTAGRRSRQDHLAALRARRKK